MCLGQPSGSIEEDWKEPHSYGVFVHPRKSPRGTPGRADKAASCNNIGNKKKKPEERLNGHQWATSK